MVWYGVNRKIINFSEASIPPIYHFSLHPFLQIILALNLCAAFVPQRQRRPLPSLMSDSSSLVSPNSLYSLCVRCGVMKPDKVPLELTDKCYCYSIPYNPCVPCVSDAEWWSRTRCRWSCLTSVTATSRTSWASRPASGTWWRSVNYSNFFEKIHYKFYPIAENSFLCTKILFKVKIGRKELKKNY